MDADVDDEFQRRASLRACYFERERCNKSTPKRFFER